MPMLRFLFGRKTKWHEVQWRHGERRIFVQLQFAPEEADAALGDTPPRVDKLPPEPGDGETYAKPEDIASSIVEAVDEYNRHNLCALRVARIRYRSNELATAADHGTATRKLLNLL